MILTQIARKLLNMVKTPQQLVDELHRKQDKLRTYEYMETLEDERFKVHTQKYKEGMEYHYTTTDVWHRTLAARSASRRDQWTKLKNESAEGYLFTWV